MPKKDTPLVRLSAHFVGIGGIGISALARWFLAQNWIVTGSDLADSQIIRSLRESGIRVQIGHKKANLPKKRPDMVIYSAAIPQNNPELAAARQCGLKPLSYPEALGCITKIYKTIAVAGSHGKSTTTSMLSLILARAKFDPNVVVGTNLKEFNGANFRHGKSKWLVMEADEWKASFLNYSPFIAVVTNIDKEHLDFYKTFGTVKKTFLKFLARAQQGGYLILNADNKTLLLMKSPILKIAKNNSLNVIWYSIKMKQHRKRVESLRKILKIPGEHNLSNAMATLAVAKILKIDVGTALRSLSNFRGTWRRMEYKGKIKNQKSKIKIKVYDDYAHHPTEIKATLLAFREKFPKKRIICVYQPHQAKRLKALFGDFVDSFILADALVFFPVYEVAGRDKTSSAFTSERLAQAIKKKYPRKDIYYLKNPAKIKKFILSILREKFTDQSPILVMMGAGDIVKFTPLLLS